MMKTFSGHTILCVDDEKHILSSLTRLLANEDYNLVTTENPKIALDILEEKDISLIISDQNMPIMMGTDLLKSIKQSHPHVVRVVLTGCADVKWVTEAINSAGIQWLIHKPWDNEHLKLSIRMLLQEYDLRNGTREPNNSSDIVDTLFRAYGGTVLNYARTRGMHQHDAEDLCQEVFLKLCGAKFRSLLLSMTRNMLIDKHRQKKAIKRGGATKTVSLNHEPVDSSGPSGSNKIDDLDTDWIQKIVNRALSLLNNHCKKEGTPFYLALQGRIGGKSYDEIAGDLSVSVDQVRSYIQQARVKAKKILAELLSKQSTKTNHDTELLYISKFIT